MELSKQVGSAEALQPCEVSCAEKSTHDTITADERRVPLPNRSINCPLYCPKPMRVSPSQKYLVFRNGVGEEMEQTNEKCYIPKENVGKTTASLSSVSGSWLTFEDGGSTSDLNDVFRRSENNLFTDVGDRQGSESADWLSSPSSSSCLCGNAHKQLESRLTSTSEGGSLSSSFKSLSFLYPEKSKNSLISDCTSCSTNMEDLDYFSFMDEKNSEVESPVSPLLRCQNPMVRDAWFLLSSKELVLDSETKSEMLRHMWIRSGGGGRRNRSNSTNWQLSSMGKSCADFRSSPALSV